MQDNELQINGTPLFYRSQGEGPTLVLLHGFGEDGRVWEGQYDLFPDHRLLIPDLPGSGRSPMTADMSMEGLAETIHQLIQALGAAPCLLIGHSMGGYVALALAERYPDSLRGLGLFHSSAFADTEEKKATRRKGIDFIRQHGADAFLETATPNLYSPDTKKERPELITRQVEWSRGFDPDALCAYYEAMMARPDRIDVLRGLPAPVLFILGRADAAVPFEDGLRQTHLPTLAVVETLDHSGHMGMQEEGEKANRVLRSFAELAGV